MPPSSTRKTGKVTLGVDSQRRPTLHVLMSDGRVTEFKSATVVIPECPHDEADTQVYGLLVNGRGEPYVDANGEPILLPTVPMTLRSEEGPETRLTWKEVARRAGVSLSTIKRAVQDDDLKGPDGIGKRAVRFRLADVEAWIASERKKRRGES